MKTTKISKVFYVRIMASILSLFLLNGTVNAAADHLYWAEKIAANVTPDKNMYASDPSYITWPDANGVGDYVNRSKCASFVTLVLMHANKWPSSYFIDWMSSISPTANTYYDTIKLQKRFVSIVNVNEIQAGDIVAIKYPRGSAVTGHMMIANATATRRASSLPLVNGTYQYELKVIDSSQSGHGTTDTRLKADGSYVQGAGIGVFRLYTDTKGVIVGHTWSTHSKSQYYDIKSRPIIIGRISQ
jgi:hypothetical protein